MFYSTWSEGCRCRWVLQWDDVNQIWIFQEKMPWDELLNCKRSTNGWEFVELYEGFLPSLSLQLYYHMPVPLFKFMIFQKLYLEVQNIIIIHMILTTYFILSSSIFPNLKLYVRFYLKYELLKSFCWYNEFLKKGGLFYNSNKCTRKAQLSTLIMTGIYTTVNYTHCMGVSKMHNKIWFS